MSQKMMYREVTSTIVKYAQIVTNDGTTELVKNEMVLVGNVPADKALKVLTKEIGVGVSVLDVEVQTEVYEMAVEDFIKLATIKVEPPVLV